MNYSDNTTKISTLFGTLITIFVNIRTEDLIKTIILAVVGASSSYIATLLLKHFLKRIKQKFLK